MDRIDKFLDFNRYDIDLKFKAQNKMLKICRMFNLVYSDCSERDYICVMVDGREDILKLSYEGVVFDLSYENITEIIGNYFGIEMWIAEEGNGYENK